MLNFLLKFFGGDKKERDVKAFRPVVEKINAEFAKLQSISDDQLRNKTLEFKKRIADKVITISAEITKLKDSAEGIEDIALKDELLNKADQLRKDRNAKLEEALLEVLPEAFAVVKETARRLSQKKELVVTATDFDRAIAATKQNVVIQGDTATWSNRWIAAGNEIEWNMVHYDVQLMGGIVLHSGKISEMATGEGKTMVATLPVYLNALTGMGVHVVTVNDYLARRDSEWNGPLFEFHQLSVDCIDRHEPNSEERRNAYRADITYGTNNEFGFDYLRDNMVTHSENLVQREHHFAIVDEVDSVLIDEARTPLIISGPVPQGDKHEFYEFKPRIERLINAQRKIVSDCLNDAKKNIFAQDKSLQEKAALHLYRAYRGMPKHSALIKFLSETGVKSAMQKVESYYLQDKGKNMHVVDDELYFTIDEQNNSVELTEKGRELITQSGEDTNLFVIPDVAARIVEIDNNTTFSQEQRVAAKDQLSQEYSEKSDRLHTINQLVKAYALFENNVDYIVQEGKVLIVDEQTGRILPGRRYSDGLHQAIEAKENVKVEAATQTFATVTLQNYFRMYHKLAGMTGTAETEESEFYQIYKLEVSVIPTHRPIIRQDRDDLVYKTKREKYNAVIDEIVKVVEQNRPVLVGTTSVEVSELLSRMLNLRKIRHNVLNAKLHQREAEIVAEAGLPGKVTIATNMAGRGTDIKLGPGVKEAGGLAIIGTERHESRRIDRQLRGRSGRQGDPGSSQFFVSLEDDLMRLFGSERIAKIMDRMGLKEGEVIQHSLITRSITNAQKKVEENNFAMRKRLLEYDDVMNSQREVVYRRRRNALFGDRIKIDIDNMLSDMCQNMVKSFYSELDAEGLRMECIRLLAFDPSITEKDLSAKKEEEIADFIFEEAKEFYRRKTHALMEHMLPNLVRIRETRPEVVFIVVDFTDGSKRFQITADLNRCIASKGLEIFDQLEKNLTLRLIDDNWKEHLREMDELRTSVQNAAIEQKDPLLVYKLESFQLFDNMLNVINREVISTIFKARLHGQDEAQAARQQELEKRDDFSRLKAKHESAVIEERNREARQLLAGSGGGPQQERQLSRRERREMERHNTKGKK